MAIEVERATRENITYTIKNEAGNAVDLTTADDVILRVSHDLNTDDESDYVIEESAGTQDSEGNAVWNLKDVDTDIEHGIYNFEIEVKYGSSQSTVPEVGKFYVRQRVEG